MNETLFDFMEPYPFRSQITENEIKKFRAGICYDIYRKMGAHPMTVDGTKGVCFAVWAPNAVRVNVVVIGMFHRWDSESGQWSGAVNQQDEIRLPMRRLGDSGIFERFVPGLETGMSYQYEIETQGGQTFLKADPYANAAQLRPDTASVITDLEDFTWSDQQWMEQRKKTSSKEQPMFVYELHLGSWKKPQDGRLFYNYRELAPMLAAYVKEMGYTHVELMPVMEHPYDGSWGYQVTGYYAPTSRYGTPQDFMYFINYLHEQGIGVILDWVPAHFPRDPHGLSAFDGTCLYEHHDPRRGSHPHWGTLIFHYGKPEVSNFLIANALFWKNVYHIDGIRVDAVASMLYLDYGKKYGEWIPNLLGGHENPEAVGFLRHLNTALKQDDDGILLIAEESTAWPKVTAPVEEGGLGFDYKWNMGWMHDTLDYMQLDPLFRPQHHGELTFSMVYAYSEDYVLSLSHDEVVHCKGSMIGKMPGKMNRKFANLRAVYGYMATHPGKKLLFMGQDFAQLSEWNENRSLEWNLLEPKGYPEHPSHSEYAGHPEYPGQSEYAGHPEYPNHPENPEHQEHRQMHTYIKALLKLYKEQPALYRLDYDPKGFEWIDSMAADNNILVYMRRSEKPDEDLLIICNFSTCAYENYRIGVPYSGKFKEIFNSDGKEFGGSGYVNPRVKISQNTACNDREDSIRVLVPPMGVSVFKCMPDETVSEREYR